VQGGRDAPNDIIADETRQHKDGQTGDKESGRHRRRLSRHSLGLLGKRRCEIRQLLLIEGKGVEAGRNVV
jgi:hypothetical protein